MHKSIPFYTLAQLLANLIIFGSENERKKKQNKQLIIFITALVSSVLIILGVFIPITFEGKTIKLDGNIDLKPLVADLSFTPIGSSKTDVPFKGTFDGNGNTIYNMYQSGWTFGYEWG